MGRGERDRKGRGRGERDRKGRSGGGGKQMRGWREKREKRRQLPPMRYMYSIMVIQQRLM